MRRYGERAKARTESRRELAVEAITGSSDALGVESLEQFISEQSVHGERLVSLDANSAGSVVELLSPVLNIYVNNARHQGPECGATAC